MKTKILFADDEGHYRKLISAFLEKEGYEVILASNGREAIDKYFSIPDISLVILDVMMPKYNGYEVCDTIRAESDVKILMLTAMGEEHHEVDGFEKGADEYISKPFSYPILMARIKALLKHRVSNEELKIGEEIVVVPISNELILNNKTYQLTNKETELLVLLFENKGLVLTREKLLNSVWGYDYDKDPRTLDTHIKSLRSKMGSNNYIKTVRGKGYMLIDEID